MNTYIIMYKLFDDGEVSEGTMEVEAVSEYAAIIIAQETIGLYVMECILKTDAIGETNAST
jgi:hypothetical protein